jgi:carboxylesterase type B
MTPSQVI